MSGYSPRAGLSAEQVAVMKSKFYKVRKSRGTDWKNLTEFCEWAVQVGYKPGMRIKRLNKTIPHSRENSYFCDEHISARKLDSGIGSPCATCTKQCDYYGCRDWEEYYKQNWQKNIHVDIPEPVQKPKPQVFRYEHPDLVREVVV